MKFDRITRHPASKSKRLRHARARSERLSRNPALKPVVDKKFEGHFLRPGHAMRRGVVGANLAVARFIGRHQP